jgi:hypothetical protein
MTSTHVLRVPRSDGESPEDYVLLSVNASSEGDDTVFSVEGTEGEMPYVAKRKIYPSVLFSVCTVYMFVMAFATATNS